MKATLEFNLPEEHQEFMQASNSGSLAAAISQYRSKLRKIIKHSDDEIDIARAEWANELLLEELEGLHEIFDL